MRSARWIPTLLWLVLPIAPPASAQAVASCTTEHVLEDYLRYHERIDPGTIQPGDRVLAYDHRRGDRWWRGYRWECPGGAAVTGCGLETLDASEIELQPAASFSLRPLAATR